MTIFHKIIAREIPAEILFEDEDVIAIKDINPQAPLHFLVIPKIDIPTLNDVQDVPDVVLSKLIKVGARIANEQGFTDYRYTVNCGPGGGQEVFQLHLHVLAGRDFSWPPG